ncbi:hypothetical protein [Gordonibacter massiliensis (ex Traore et al. 2017)]|uniref:hypothetical protein n=1 Tax=Gordonibacter massiliensis (ex Traore et al. 2017) TaxID=1841863 RepID=UPI001C8C3234|nr:hypothetical protein [Gordonibacter massiliensis (ex Traore et al. 2017)]MBX9033900.1 hypothetical protein [Gordonibacter massiliensis (ex Traore et al. 2017)]
MDSTIKAKPGKILIVALAVVCAAAVWLFASADRAFAADPNEAITVQQEVNGVTTEIGTINYAELQEAGLVNSDTIAGLFNKPGTGFNVVGGKNYVKIDDLFAYMEVPSTVWTTGAKLHYTCDDGDYSKWESDYNEITRTQFFFSATTLLNGITATAVPTYGAIAFDNAQVKIPAATDTVTPTAGTTLANISSWDTTPRIIAGLTADELNDSNYNMGKRMPGGIDTITIIAPTVA